jgi:hypothetical protein
VNTARFGNSGYGVFRGPTQPNLDMSLFRTLHFKGSQTLQLRAECFNIFNTAHLTNPASNISNLVLNADGSVKSLNGVGSISATDRTGRMYDERELRLGVRFGF